VPTCFLFGPAIQACPLDTVEGPTLTCCSGRAATHRNNRLQRSPPPCPPAGTVSATMSTQTGPLQPLEPPQPLPGRARQRGHRDFP
jgi:hypothetical protein